MITSTLVPGFRLDDRASAMCFFEHKTSNLGVGSSNLSGRASIINNLVEIGPVQRSIGVNNWRLRYRSAGHGYADEDRRIMAAVARLIVDLVEGRRDLERG